MGSHEEAIHRSGVTLVFVQSPSQASEKDHFEIFSCQQEKKLVQ